VVKARMMTAMKGTKRNSEVKAEDMARDDVIMARFLQTVEEFLWVGIADIPVKGAPDFIEKVFQVYDRQH